MVKHNGCRPEREGIEIIRNINALEGKVVLKRIF